MQSLKFTVVGDGVIGKTCMLISYTQNEFPEEHVPTVFDNHACNLTVDGKDYNLSIWDTAGQEDYAKLRELSYPDTNCFIICYSIDSRDSFQNVKAKWSKEIREYDNQVPIILVGTKSDLRVLNSDKYVTTGEGLKMKKKIKASSLIECSAKRMENLEHVFCEGVRATLNSKKSKQSCTIL